MSDDTKPRFVTIGVTHHYAEGRSKRVKRNLSTSEWEATGVATRLLREMGEELALRVGGDQATG